MNIVIFIPARYASTRLPAKPLCDIGGKSLIQRVYEQLLPLHDTMPIWVLTDDERIYTHVEHWNGRVLMTQSQHQSGTERCAEALSQLQAQGIYPDIIVNVQGDEPMVLPEQITALTALFSDKTVQIATLIKKITDLSTLNNHNRPKVVRDINGKALYFSRQAIPYCRDTPDKALLDKQLHYKHIGMYAYRSDILPQLAQLAPTALEQAESLEQLRWLEHGYAIHTQITQHESPAIDTPEDLVYVRQFFE
jgi:3-deoxy-manno-octulosonate cytidylyltransferase (CMP-KDO synthetase)